MSAHTAPGRDEIPRAAGDDGSRPGGSPWRYRQVILNFARRNLKTTYKDTALGWIWSLLLPLATVATYTIVFSVIFRAAPPDFGNGEPGIFAVWFMVGLVAFSFFMQSLTGGMPALLGAGPLLQKVYLPAYVPVFGSMLAVLVQTLIELGVVAAFLLVFSNVGPTWLLVPIWLVVFVVFVGAISFVFALLNVRNRDLSKVVSALVRLLFFASPIIYPLSIVPEYVGPVPIRAIVEYNPISQFIITLRQLMYGLQTPELWQVLYLLLWALAVAGLAAAVWRKLGRDIGEATL